MWLAVGLGNPGGEYTGTRHNIGFIVLDRLWRRNRAEPGILNRLFRNRPKKEATLCSRTATVTIKDSTGVSVVCLWPLTYMNRSGKAVSAASRKYRIEPEKILIIHDDLDLPLGKVKVKLGGGAGGHKGLISLMKELEVDRFVRVRCGIGRPESGGDIVDYVLSPFSVEEYPVVAEMIETACDAVDAVFGEGPVAAMNRFNKR